MIHIKDHKQYDMFNPFEYLGPKRLALLQSSWAHLFREEILHKLPAEKLFHLYDEFKGRRTKELFHKCQDIGYPSLTLKSARTSVTRPPDY
jgi:hypothetical protein